jgi:hypothetical protein
VMRRAVGRVAMSLMAILVAASIVLSSGLG